MTPEERLAQLYGSLREKKGVGVFPTDFVVPLRKQETPSLSWLVAVIYPQGAIYRVEMRLEANNPPGRMEVFQNGESVEGPYEVCFDLSEGYAYEPLQEQDPASNEGSPTVFHSADGMARRIAEELRGALGAWIG